MSDVSKSCSFVVVGVHVLAVNEKGQVLLKQIGDRWEVPGALLGLGEELEDAARRCFFEETGLVMGSMRLVGVFSGPKYRFQFDDELAYLVTAVYATSEIYGEFFKANRIQYFSLSQVSTVVEKVHLNFIETFRKQSLPGVYQ
ncbi:ADP-ribose pyrophosphatase YjhB (NUDIX family) [Laceyella sediminis]|uniref:ADP-ribose pyrophosphatase YjhB (NUDIX family) n=1 Tax=Laceyella sediminis TaxID=573074 RepID=A0ABX5EMS6_9BACL|nr:NUDIX domain-containing protein [Laceyella sediminis]PRZ13611.1 ADP-ribose pyrophosphatase YjhB (NUDIX family) [Laceyella sediminis]